jgi:cytochrome c556
MKNLLICAALGLAVSSSAMSQVQPKEAVHYRKAAFTTLVWNWMPLVNMVRGKTPYDKASFEKHATRVAFIATTLQEGFVPNSAIGKSEAKPEIWKNWTDFQAKSKALEVESAALSSVAKNGDFEKIKAQFKKVGDTCKACHDLYKAD